MDQLNRDQLKSVAKELKLLEVCGSDLRLPHGRSLGQRLFELRERRYGLRIYYTFLSRRTIILLNAGDKGGQQKDISLARTRLDSLPKTEEE